MKWHNPKVDKLPNNKQEVLVSYQGVYHLAIFDLDKKSFHLKSNPGSSLKIEDNTLYWTEIVSPQ